MLPRMSPLAAIIPLGDDDVPVLGNDEAAADRNVANDSPQDHDLTGVVGVGRDAADPCRVGPAEERREGPDVALDGDGPVDSAGGGDLADQIPPADDPAGEPHGAEGGTAIDVGLDRGGGDRRLAGRPEQ